MPKTLIQYQYRHLQDITGTAFEYCTSLENLTFENGNSEVTIGTLKVATSTYDKAKGAFYNCPLKHVYIGRNLSYNTGYTYGYTPFKDINTLESAVISENITRIPNYLFYLTGLKTVSIPNSVKTIGSYSFAYTNLENIVIPASVTNINECAFFRIENIKTLIFEDGLEDLTISSGDTDYLSMFAYNKNSEYTYIGRQIIGAKNYYPLLIYCADSGIIEFGNSVRYIPEHSIAVCGANYLYDKVSKIIFGESLAVIAPDNCVKYAGAKLTEIVCKSTLPPYVMDPANFLPSVDVNVCTLYVPKESIELYKADSFWQKFFLIEPLEVLGNDGDTDADAIVKERLYLQQTEHINLNQYINNIEISNWTNSDDRVIEFNSESADVNAISFGESTLRGTDSEGKVIAIFDIFVCPILYLEHGDGIVYALPVIYNSRPVVYLAEGQGYKLAGVTHDDKEITDDLISLDGYYTPSSPITEDSTINISLEQDNGGQSSGKDSVFSDSAIRIYTIGNDVNIKGVSATAEVKVTTVNGVNVLTTKDKTFSLSSGVYLINIENESRTFKIIVK